MDDDDEKDLNKSLKKVRQVFAILDKDNFELYKDLHLEVKLLSFKREDIHFIDMGTCLNIKDQQEKMYQIRMVHNNKEK